MNATRCRLFLVLIFGSRVFALSFFLNVSRFALLTRITFNGRNLPQGMSIDGEMHVLSWCWCGLLKIMALLRHNSQCNLMLDKDAEEKETERNCNN